MMRSIRRLCKWLDVTPVSFLKEVQPKNPFYYQLLEKLKAGGLGKAMKIKILCNMERCRWRQYDNPWQHEKYVVVNIPSFHLMAIDHQDTLSMRIGCGASKTKTPILNSHIKRMELNPQWFVPRSIVLHDMIHRVGNHAYFHSRNYYVREVATGKEVDLDRVTRSMLISGAYGIAEAERGMLWEESSSVLIIISLSSCMILTARECSDEKIEAFHTDASE